MFDKLDSSKPNKFMGEEFIDFEKDVMEYLEMMAAAYLKETDIPIKECELVVEYSFNKIIYRFQRRNIIE